MRDPKIQRVVVMNGSIRKNKTSYQFALSLEKIALDQGCQTELLHVIDYFEKPDRFSKLHEILESADLLIFTMPLYVDTLPYIDIWFLEQLQFQLREVLIGKGLMVVAQCGFPDIKLNACLLESCRFFAEETGMVWLGGLSYGGGAALDGQPLKTAGSQGAKIERGLRMAMAVVLQGQPVPDEAQKAIALKIPKWVLKPLAHYLNYASKKEGRKNGLYDLTDTPYRVK